MTPDLLDEGAKRASAFAQKRHVGRTESGGREAGFGGMGFTPQSQGGTHIVERNLTRLTTVMAVLFFVNTVVIYRLLA